MNVERPQQVHVSDKTWAALKRLAKKNGVLLKKLVADALNEKLKGEKK